MKLLLPVVYVTNMARSRPFYEALGFEHRRTSRSGKWQEFQLGSTWLALHHSSTLPPFTTQRIELGLAVNADELDALARRLEAAQPKIDIFIVDEAFGRSFTIYDPDGLALLVMEQDVELYTTSG